MNPVRIVIEGDRVTVKCPSSFAPFVSIDKVTTTGVRLGAWPEGVYAGRQMAGLGHRVKLEHLPLSRA